MEAANRDRSLADTIGDTYVLKAEVAHAVKNEMAWNLSDVVFRRTDLASGGNPGEDALRTCAGLMAELLKWDEQETEKQMDAVLKRFPSWKNSN